MKTCKYANPDQLPPSLPLAEIHVHLDGGLRSDTILELAKAQNISIPWTSPEQMAHAVFPPSYPDLDSYLRGFGLTCRVMTTEAAIERVAYEARLDAGSENVRYMETRMAPQLLARPDMPVQEVLHAINRGMTRAERELNLTLEPWQAPFRHGIIACVMRSAGPGYGWIYGALAPEYPVKGTMEVQAALRLVAECREARQDLGPVLCGFDLAGSELQGPCAPFQKAFSMAADLGLGITVHAGEARGAASIADAIHLLGASRIGHGTALYNPLLDQTEDPPVDRIELAALIKERQICLEVCLKSNLDTKAVARLESHPLKEMMQNGLRISLSTDNRLVSHTTLRDEFQRACDCCGIGIADQRKMAMTGFESAFFPGAPDEHRDYLNRIRREIS